jgi:AcrR family transcriptional regulator
MAPPRPAGSSTSPPGGDPVRPAPIIRRPKPEDALESARAAFVAEERVELATLAVTIDVSQATLYRWFGSREQLIDRVLGLLTDEFTSDAKAEVEGDGDERILDFIRRVMTLTVGFGPVRTLIAKEPQLALRLLLGEGEAVHRGLVRALRDVIAESRSPEQARALESEIDTIVQVGTALQWATLAVGDEPQLGRVMDIARALLAVRPAA